MTGHLSTLKDRELTVSCCQVRWFQEPRGLAQPKALGCPTSTADVPKLFAAVLALSQLLKQLSRNPKLLHEEKAQAAIGDLEEAC